MKGGEDEGGGGGEEAEEVGDGRVCENWRMLVGMGNDPGDSVSTVR